MKNLKTSPAIQEAIDKATADFRKPDAKECFERNPYIASSNCSDAYVITCWSIYWHGKPPIALTRSRGYTWNADLPGYGFLVKLWVSNWRDHRDGIVIGKQIA